MSTPSVKQRKVGENTVFYPIEDETISITVLREGTITVSKATHREFSPSEAYLFAAGMIAAAREAERIKP